MRICKGIWLLVITVMLFGMCGCGGDGTAAFSDIPEYSGAAYVTVKDNRPSFAPEDISVTPYERYSPLDVLGRCGAAVACIGRESLPSEPEDEDCKAYPSGWTYGEEMNCKSYPFIDGGYIYNKCHLISGRLTDGANREENIIAGTRYMNTVGMTGFESEIALFLRESDMHVMYRVTPIYRGNELVARGVLMEATSCEDGGKALSFAVFCHNVQPNIEINYRTGANRAVGDGDDNIYLPDDPARLTLVMNRTTKVYHSEQCVHAKGLKPENRYVYTGSIEYFRQAYPDFVPCSVCKPDGG